MQTAQDDPALKKQKKVGYSIAGSLSLFIHLGILLLIGGTVIVESIIPKQAMTGEVQVSESVIESPPEELPEDTPQDVPQPTDAVQPQSATAESSPFDMNTVVMDTPSPSFTMTLGATSATPGLPGTGAPGGSQSSTTGAVGTRKKVSFQGIESEAEAVGFYLDFSGTMDGERKKKMMIEMEKTLKDLPDGMRVMIINWAGPAWSLEQKPAEVKKFWTMNSALDWKLPNPAKVDAPRYFTLSNSVRKQILKLLEETQQQPGGTDWRSPFVLAAKAKPAPDVIYLMTDGQHSNEKMMLDGIDAALKSSTPADAVVNVVAVAPSEAEGKALKALSRKHQGKYTEVK